jgi:hypothetical protein
MDTQHLHSGYLSSNNKTGAKFENLPDAQQQTLLLPTVVISFTCNVSGYRYVISACNFMRGASNTSACAAQCFVGSF